MTLKISRIQRLSAVIGISFCFFLAEISGMHFLLLITRLHFRTGLDPEIEA